MLETHYYFTPILDHLEPFDHNDWHLYPIVTLPAAKQLRDAEDLPKNIVSLNACYDRLRKVSLDYLNCKSLRTKTRKSFSLIIAGCFRRNDDFRLYSSSSSADFERNWRVYSEFYGVSFFC